MASTKTKYVSMNLLDHQKNRLEELVRASGTNRNQFFRMLIEKLEEDDVEELMAR